MPSKLMDLRLVPEDELEEVTALLDQHDMAHYLTPEGAFGVTSAALWLEDESQLTAAKALLAEYQAMRGAQARAAYQTQKNRGEHRTFWQHTKAQPVQVVVYIVLALFFIYLLAVPVWDLLP